MAEGTGLTRLRVGKGSDGWIPKSTEPNVHAKRSERRATAKRIPAGAGCGAAPRRGRQAEDTPLIVAAREGAVEAVQALLSSRANIAAHNRVRTPAPSSRPLVFVL